MVETTQISPSPSTTLAQSTDSLPASSIITNGGREREENNDAGSANKINLNTKYTGNLQTDKDVDFYEFTVNTKGKVSISFEHAKFDSGDRYWEVYIISGKNDSEIMRLFSNGREASLI